MIHELFVTKVNELIERKVDTVAAGRCETLQSYTQACGEILGLRIALAEYLEIVDQVQKENDGEPIA